MQQSPHFQTAMNSICMDRFCSLCVQQIINYEYATVLLCIASSEMTKKETKLSAYVNESGIILLFITYSMCGVWLIMICIFSLSVFF